MTRKRTLRGPAILTCLSLALLLPGASGAGTAPSPLSGPASLLGPRDTLAAVASANITSGQAPLAVSFTGSATGGTPPYSWSWTFGDGSGNPFQQNPPHTYTTPGTYTVTLKVTDASHTTATDNHLVITVTSDGTCTVTCSASVPSNGTVDNPVAFSSAYTASDCPTPPIFSWTFGDETPPALTQNASHTYSSTGTYSWTYSVTVGGQACTKAGTITITGGGCTVTCSAMAPPTGTIGTPVQFMGGATPSNCTGQLNFAWDFGDQSPTSDQLMPMHTYAAAGTYTWTMTATVDGIPCSKPGTIIITAQAAKPGDCNGDDAVSIGEVQKAINMFLGVQSIDCGVDCNRDATVSIGEVQKVINAFLGLQSTC